jgi:hypothetical protein
VSAAAWLGFACSRMKTCLCQPRVEANHAAVLKYLKTPHYFVERFLSGFYYFFGRVIMGVFVLLGFWMEQRLARSRCYCICFCFEHYFYSSATLIL